MKSTAAVPQQRKPPSRRDVAREQRARQERQRRERRGPRPLRRLWNHLARSRARAGFLLAAASMVIYTEVPSTDQYDPLRQFVLVLASVAAGAIFLPELSGDLWTINSDQVRKLIPDARRRSLSRALIDAESTDQEWNSLVFTEALMPMIEAGRSPWQNVRNLNYAIRVQADRPSPVPALGPTAHLLDTVLHADRVLPPFSTDGSYWVSIARSQAALTSEFEQPCCIYREFVEFGDIDGEEWYDLVVRVCQVGVVINGQAQDINIDAFDPSAPDIVRYRFNPEFGDPAQRVPLRISVDFPVPASMSVFPVIFSGYYCAGATVVSVKMHHGPIRRALECEPFFARRLGAYRDRTLARRQGLDWEEMSFATGRDSVMWPGSGVLFSWYPAERQQVTAAAVTDGSAAGRT